MSGGEAAGGDATADDSGEDQAYFRAIEDVFVRLRGAPLLLSPADWQTARRWRRSGVPLDLVARSLEELFARRRERGAKGRVNSLRYFAPAVEAAWEEIQGLTAPGRVAQAPPLDLRARLQALAAALPADLARRGEWAERVGGLAGDTEAVERALAVLDEELVAAVEGGLSAEDRRAIAEEAGRTLAALSGRLPAEEIESARHRLERQLLRRRRALPVLSLFSPEAIAGESGESGETA